MGEYPSLEHMRTNYFYCQWIESVKLRRLNKQHDCRPFVDSKFQLFAGNQECSAITSAYKYSQLEARGAGKLGNLQTLTSRSINKTS